MKNVREMSLSELEDISPVDLVKLSSEDAGYVAARIRESMTDDELFQRAKKLDTGIYDEQGNLIGDKCMDEDDYEW